MTNPINTNLEEIDDEEELFSFLPFLLQEKGLLWARHKTAQVLVGKGNYLSLSDREILEYRDGIYQSGGINTIRKKIQWIWGEKATRTNVSEIIGHIIRTTLTNPADLNPSLNIVPVKNGLLDIEKRELLPFSPEKKYTFKINAEYDPDATCPAIDSFFEEVLFPEDIPTMYEIIGYCLYRKYIFQKAVMFMGEGGNGKTVTLNLMRNFLGAKNVVSSSLQKLEQNTFESARLFGMLAVLHADLSPIALQSTGTFKMLTGGDTISAQKKFGDPFDFENYAKLIFSANTLPQVNDDTPAFFRRWVLITFPNTFDEKTADPKKVEKLTSPEELSGLLNRALDALSSMLERGGFSNTKSSEEIQKEYILRSDSIHAFVLEMLEPDADGEILKETMYQKYIQFCNQKKIPSRSKTALGRNIGQYISVTESHPKIQGRQRKAWRGARFRDELPKKPSTLEGYSSGVSPLHPTVIHENTPSPGDRRRVMGKIEEHISSADTGDGVEMDALLSIGADAGMEKEDLLELLEDAKMRGRIYEWKPGFFRLVSGKITPSEK